MTVEQSDNLIFEAAANHPDKKIKYVCQCGRVVIARSATLKKKPMGEVLLCPGCSSSRTKQARSAEETAVIVAKRQATNIQKYGSTNVLTSSYGKKKAEETYIDKHGDLTTAFSERHKVFKQNMLEKRGVENPMQDASVVKTYQDNLLKKHGSIERAYKKRAEKTKKTCLDRLGYPSNLVTPEQVARTKDVLLKKLGVDHPMRSQAVKEKMIEKYGTIGSSACGYSYEGIRFDSSFELAYYVYLTDKNINFEYHPNRSIAYIGEDGRQHMYCPDFLLKDSDVLVELKGGLFFDKEGRPVNPYSKRSWQCKLEAMLRHNVLLYKEDDMKPILRYVEEIKGKRFIGDCQIKKLS